MFTAGPDLPQKCFQIKQEDGKFFSSLLTKESSMANPSFRVYYGGVSVAVPFMWESQPGTPKNKLCENILPPLTPPPSYYSASSKTKPIKKHSRSNLLHILFPGIVVKRRANASTLPTNSASTLSPTSSSASWSSFISSGSLPPALPPRKSRRRSLGSLFDSGYHGEDPPLGNGGWFRGCYGWK